ncbi:BON domain-containing protein [Deinococcus oregonensis]|uniref:BON domain-containing protein n=1 Tax=Deinococcus oregonensis TaxID=1805970 RepID=A0ABV6AXP4_9DEIO
MTRFPDDRYDDRNNNMQDERRQGQDDRGLLGRVGEFFQGRDDRSRSGMGIDSGMDQGRMDQNADWNRNSGMGMGMDSGNSNRSSGQEYGQGQGYGSGQFSRMSGGMGYGQSSQMSSGMGYGSGQSGRMGYGSGRQEQGSGMGGMFSGSFRDDRQSQGGMSSSMGMGSGMGMGTDQSGMMSHRGKGPKGYQRNDDRIREEVNDALEDDHGVDASNIEVQVQGGEVTLTGTVTDRQQKRRAEEAIEHLRGVRDVHNQLRMAQGGQGGAMQGGMGQTSTAQDSTTVIVAAPDETISTGQL